MLRFLSLFPLIIFLLSGSLPAQEAPPETSVIFQALLKKATDYSTLRYHLIMHERVNGKMTEQISQTKVEKEPFKVYIKKLAPKAGIEVLYIDGVNNNQALVNPNGFPWMNLNLDPNGSTMRDGTHHTLLNSGFTFFADVLASLSTKYATEIQQLITYQGEEKVNGTDCYKLMLENPHFTYVAHTVKKGENVVSIARKYKVSEHMIVEKNSGVNDYNDVTEGQIIKVPNDYAKKMLVYVDKKRFLPIKTQIYDEIGLYEEYIYPEVEINPVFKPNEFSKDFEGYGF